MAVVSWDKIQKTKGGGGAGIFLKLTDGKHKVRLIGKAYEYRKHWEPIPVSCPGKSGGCPICLADAKNEARVRYAINILDRDDGNKLKILDAGPQIFTSFRDYFDSTQIDPGGKEGPDMIIKVEVPSGDPRRKKYSVIPLNSQKLTEDEVKILKEKGLHDLDKIFGPKTSQEITELLKSGGSSKEPDKSESSESSESKGQSSGTDYQEFKW